ncbi:PRELI-like family-domain-containing protein [Radiomyces spectabilis]|uniref:PRELI-like family-domain-containing protein n=1 Tax=Radiomyces spectabilis TaxID=64574 RepID=UPI00221F2459|nr:PRELI-like family-domain-containing protein [Radiomyces spectabilis]KAI8381351.1 PRELI-like family-domain-containing protein [Radiomyces spectabilis]
MKLFKSVHEYNYPWNLVSAANWQKYPNEHCPHVQHVDVLNRSVDPETGILTTERLITVNQNMPKFILKLLGTDTTHYVHEISIIDPNEKTLTMHSRNLTMSHLLAVNETIAYSEHPEDKQRTQFTQQAQITAGTTLHRWANMVEDVSLKRFQQNALVGKEGFNKVLERFVVMSEAASDRQQQ